MVNTKTGYVHDRSDELAVEECLSKEMYSLDYNKLKENLPTVGAKYQLQSFIDAAGFKRTQILYKEKWLSRISVNSSLCAFSHGFSLGCLNGKIETFSKQELLLTADLMLEAINGNGNGNNSLLGELIEKILPFDESFCILSKVLTNADAGFIALKASTLEKMFEYHPNLVNSYCEILQKSQKEHQNSRMLKVCSESPQLYDIVCRNLTETCETLLPKFVENMCRDGDIFLLYPSYEQPCVMLCQMLSILELPLRSLHYSKVMYELHRLWLTHSESVPKLIRHFPYLLGSLTDCCDKDVNAKRLCLNLMSCNPKCNQTLNKESA